MMSIRSLHENLKSAIAKSMPNKHPKIGDNEVLAKNVFEPYNMRAISKSKLEKVGHNEELGDMYLFSVKEGRFDNLYLYSDKLKAYGKAGEVLVKDRIIGMIETGLPPSFVENMREGLEHEDQVELYVPKEITKIVKGVAAKYNKTDNVQFEFSKDGVHIFAEKDASMFNLFYPAEIDRLLVGKSIDQEDAKSMKAGVWELMDSRLYDYTNHGIKLSTSGYLKKIGFPSRYVELSGANIKEASKFVSKAVDKNNPKTDLNYLMIEVEGGKGKFVGTDTRRLSVSSEFPFPGEDGKYFIHGSRLSDNPISIKVAKDAAQIEYSDHIMTEEDRYTPRFPEYQRIIPTQMPHSVELEAKELKGIRGDICIAAKDNKLYWGEVSYETWEEPVYTDMKKVKVKSVSGGDVYFVIDAKYIKDAMENSKTVTINIKDKRSPITVDGDHGMTVIMPIVVQTKEEKREAQMRKQDRQYEANVAKAKREEAEAKKEAEALERQKEEDGIAHDFLMSMKPMEAGRARKTLSKLIRYDGEVMEKKDFIAKLHDKGYSPEYSEWREYSRKLDRNVDKKGWSMVQKDNSTGAVSGAYDITATESKFAQFLQNNQ